MKALSILLFLLVFSNSFAGKPWVRFSWKAAGIKNISIDPLNNDYVIPALLRCGPCNPFIMENPIPAPSPKDVVEAAKLLTTYTISKSTSQAERDEVYNKAKSLPNGFISYEDIILNTLPQKDDWSCSLNCAARLYDYYGSHWSADFKTYYPADAYQFLIDHCDYGSLPTRPKKIGPAAHVLAELMNKYNYKAGGVKFRYISGTNLETIYELTRAGYPVIVMFSEDSTSGHYEIVTEVNWNERTVELLDTDGEIEKMPMSDFDYKWNLKNWNAATKTIANAEKRSIIFKSI